MSELARRHERVQANATRAAQDGTVTNAALLTTVGVMGETVEDLKARLPDMKGLHDWLVRIEDRLARIEQKFDAIRNAIETTSITYKDLNDR